MPLALTCWVRTTVALAGPPRALIAACWVGDSVSKVMPYWARSLNGSVSLPLTVKPSIFLLEGGEREIAFAADIIFEAEVDIL